jgi:hypothetical protein
MIGNEGQRDERHEVLTSRAPSTTIAKVILACFVPMNLVTIPYGLVLMWIHGGTCELGYGALWIHLTKDYIKQTSHNPPRGFVGKTLGHVIILSKFGETLRTATHEMVHIEQVEAVGLLGLIFGWSAVLAGAHWSMFLIQFLSAPGLFYLCGSLVAILRGEDKYRGNFLEEAAYGHEHK